MSWLSRLTNAFRPDRLDAELEEELRFHLEARAEEAVHRGANPQDAAVEARLRLGNPLHTRETSRDAKLLPWLESLLRDARFGFRMLRKDSAVTAAALASLALAIGASLAAFALVDALLLRPLPLPCNSSTMLVVRSASRTFPPFSSRQPDARVGAVAPAAWGSNVRL